jgi:hypothetical protein
MAETKKKVVVTTGDTNKETLAQKLNSIAAKNSQIIAVRNMQEGKEKLKDKIGRKPSPAESGIQGLQGLASLKNTLGTQGNN